MKKVPVVHDVSYTGKRTAGAFRTESGGLKLEGIGYYEDEIEISAEQLRELGFVVGFVDLVEPKIEEKSAAQQYAEARVRFANGTRVQVVAQLDSNRDRGYVEECLRIPGVIGTVTGFHDSHGLCFDVAYDGDRGLSGTFDPDEISPIEGEG